MKQSPLADRRTKFSRTLSVVVLKYPGSLLFLSVLAVALLASALPQLRSDNTLESLLRRDDPDLERYRIFQRTFGQDRILLVTVEPDSLYSETFMERMEALHTALAAEVPYVAEITSLVNVRNTEGLENGIHVADLFETLPKTFPERTIDLRKKIESTPLYRRGLISGDQTMTLIALEPALAAVSAEELIDGFEDIDSGPSRGSEIEGLSDAQIAEMITSVRTVISRFDAPGFRLRLSGDLADTEYMTTLLEKDAAVTLLGSIFLNCIVLAVLFRSFVGVLLPLLTVGLSLLGSFGVLSMLGIPFSATMSILPTLIIVVSIGNSVHIMSSFYIAWGQGVDRRTALGIAIREKSIPVVIACLTTAAGLASLAGAQIGQVADLGMAAPVAVTLSLLLSLLLLPSLLAVCPLQIRRGAGSERVQSRIGVALAHLADRAYRHRLATLGGAGIVSCIALAGVLRLRFESEPLGWLPDEDPVYQTASRANEAFSGIVPLEILITSADPGGVRSPAFLKRIDDVITYLDSAEYSSVQAANALSIVDVVKETHRALNEGADEYYAIPNDGDLLSQELLLFESAGPDEIEDLTDPSFSIARITARVPYFDQMRYPEFLDQLAAGIRSRIGTYGTVEFTGAANLFGKVVRTLSYSMTQSYLIAMVLISALMIWLLRNLRLGLLSMIPNLFPVIMTLGMMGWLDIPIDSSIIVVGCVIIGLAVDDTIHFMEPLARAFAKTPDTRAVIRATIETVGPAMLTTTLVLTVGFLTSLVAYLDNLVQFGITVITGAICALFADLVIAPTLIAQWVGEKNTGAI